MGALIAFRPDRLGARLISLVTAMRIADDYDLPFQVSWTETQDVGRVFNDPHMLFHADFIAEHFLGAQEWQKRKANIPAPFKLAQHTPQQLAEHLATGADVIVGNYYGVLKLADEDIASVRASFSRAWRRLPLADALQPRLARIEQEMQGVTAYHIRRGDLISIKPTIDSPWPNKYVPDEFFREHIAREISLSHRKIIIFSDDTPLIERFQKEFPQVHAANILFDDQTLPPGARDLLELVAMSHAQSIVAPERSAFSSTASELGNVPKRNIMIDLGDTLKERAHTALYHRLTHAPESFIGPGEISQSLAHTVPWLEDNERPHDAAAILQRGLENGLDAAFLFPKLMTLQHRLGNLDGVIATAKRKTSLDVHSSRTFAQSETLLGCAYLRKGDEIHARRHLINAYCQAPKRIQVRAVIGFLLDTGILNADNFLPTNDFLLQNRRQKGPASLIADFLPELLAQKTDGTIQNIASIDVVVLDWLPFMRIDDFKHPQIGHAIPSIRRRIKQFADNDRRLDACTQSLDMLLAAYQDNVQQARATLETIVAGHPDCAQAVRRLSHVCWLMKDCNAATLYARRALAIQNVPAMNAWLGMLLMQDKAWEEAEMLFAQACQAGWTFNTVSSWWLKCLEKTSQHVKALQVLDDWIQLNPMDGWATCKKARILAHLGQETEAITLLKQMIAREFAPQSAYLHALDLLVAVDRPGEARALLSDGLRKFPNSKALDARTSQFDGMQRMAKAG